MKQLYKHQQAFIDRNPDKALLCHEAGTGKTLTAIHWLMKRPNKKALVVAPKGVQLMWNTNLKEWGVEADVVKLDAVKKISLDKYQAIVIDEAQNFCSPLFSKARSQRATVLYNLVKARPDIHILALSATPIRSHPENLHTLACYLGVYWDIKKFRDEFCHLTNKFGIMHMEPNKDWRVKIRPKLEQIADIVNMKDCRDVPIHEHQNIDIKWTQRQEILLNQQYLEPAKEWHARHRLEQGEEKWQELEKILDGHRKVVVVCYYLEQITDYVKRIGNDRAVYVMTGATKNQGEVVKEANDSDDAILFVQAGLGAGFDLDKFSVMVFASMSFAFVHLIQMQARINRIHNLHKNQYIYLIGGRCDRDVKKQLDLGFDFHPPHYYNKGDGTTKLTTSAEQTGGESNTNSAILDQEELPF